MTRYLIAALVACGLLMYGGWQKIQHQTGQLDQQAQDIDTLQRAAESRRNTIKLLADLDTQHTQERERANQTNASLRADVAAGKRRLSVLATSCTATGSATAAGVGHAEARAELDPAAAERIVRIANDGDDAIRQLNALQDYVRTACTGPAQ
ncbi:MULTISPECIES: lysis system i-spanin subunit Rz [unclassified Pseudomonas]|uniref:lysis system i-spanin subunit Rz n=1 Tax=unclassified Pseudomonas TaxID=196821 RepID=UPI002097C7EE|nr:MULTISPECIES: lysis system i-spanin subunit Rz [unclassified Pseudomonas]MCO7503185.1 lysis protein [Pseudomonas sp. VE 267-6A]MCO7532463.1 lysis protein [Pseudomonas sp. 2]